MKKLMFLGFAGGVVSGFVSLNNPTLGSVLLVTSMVGIVIAYLKEK